MPDEASNSGSRISRAGGFWADPVGRPTLELADESSAPLGHSTEGQRVAMGGIMTAVQIQEAVKRLSGFYGVYVPEFTFRGRRIDAVIIDVGDRRVCGFEIKVTRADFFEG